MSLKRSLIRSAAKIYSVKESLLPSQGQRVLMYHSITRKPFNADQDAFTVSFENFRDQMQFLKKSNFDFSITFDDGYQDNLLLAAPLLVELKIPFTVFISSAYVRENQSGFLTSNEVRELAKLPGAKIGSHSNRHIRLTQLSAAEVKQELEISKRYLEDLTGYPVEEFAYPFGATSTQVQDLVKQAGFKKAYSSYAGVNTESTNPFLLNRTEINSFDTLKDFELKMLGAYDWRRLIQFSSRFE